MRQSTAKVDHSKSYYRAVYILLIAVITYDSLPYFHFSVYRPISMFPMFVASFLLLFTDSGSKAGDILYWRS